MSGSDDRVRTARSLLLRAVEFGQWIHTATRITLHRVRGGSTPQTNEIVGPGTEPLLRLWHRASKFRFFFADERQKPKLNRRFRSATADVVALEVGVDIAADS